VRRAAQADESDELQGTSTQAANDPTIRICTIYEYQQAFHAYPASVEIRAIYAPPGRHRGLGKQVAKAAFCCETATGRRQTRRVVRTRFLGEAFCVFVREVLRRGRQQTTGCSASRRVGAASDFGQGAPETEKHHVSSTVTRLAARCV